MTEFDPGAPATPAGDASAARRVARNVALISAAQLVVRGLTFVYNIFLARYLGVTEYGRYTYAFALVALIGCLGEWGFGLLTTRDVARHRDQASLYVTNLSLIDLLLSVMIVALALLVHHLRHGDPTLRLAVLLVVIYYTCANVNNVLNGVLRGLERLDVEGALSIVEKVFTVGIGLFGIHAHWSMLALVAVIAAAGVMQTTLTSIVIHRRFVPLRLQVDLAAWPRLAREGIPLGVAGVMMVAYYRVDMVLIPILCGAHALGIYAAARKIQDVLSVLPAYFMNAVLPQMSIRYQTGDPTALQTAAERSIRLTGILTACVTSFLCVMADPLVPLLLGQQFRGAVAILRIVIWCFVFSGTNYMIWTLLAAANRQGEAVRCTATSLVVNVLLNLLLLPRYGIAGAACTLLGTEILTCVLMTRAARCHGFPLPLFHLLWRPLLSALIAVAVGAAAAHVAPVAAAVASVAAYCAAIALTAALPADERRLLARLWRRGRAAA